MEIHWSKQLSVGNATLDAEHQQIFLLVDGIDCAIKAKSIQLFSASLKQLNIATRQHFLSETKIAQIINYHFDDHNLEHEYILKEMQFIEEELSSKSGRWSESIAEHYFQFLCTWAIDHIGEDDMKMKALLEGYPYDFKPANLES